MPSIVRTLPVLLLVAASALASPIAGRSNVEGCALGDTTYTTDEAFDMWTYGPPYPNGVTDKWLADCCAKDPSAANRMSGPASLPPAVGPSNDAASTSTPGSKETLKLATSENTPNGQRTPAPNAIQPNGAAENMNVGKSSGTTSSPNQVATTETGQVTGSDNGQVTSPPPSIVNANQSNGAPEGNTNVGSTGTTSSGSTAPQDPAQNGENNKVVGSEQASGPASSGQVSTTAQNGENNKVAGSGQNTNVGESSGPASSGQDPTTAQNGENNKPVSTPENAITVSEQEQNTDPVVATPEEENGQAAGTQRIGSNTGPKPVADNKATVSEQELTADTFDPSLVLGEASNVAEASKCPGASQ